MVNRILIGMFATIRFRYLLTVLFYSFSGYIVFLGERYLKSTRPGQAFPVHASP